MYKKKILFVFGTRPEAIKMVPIIRELEKYPDMFNPLVVVSGQHREMLDQVLGLFKIKPDYDLMIMEDNQSIPQVVSRSLLGLEEIVPREKPDFMFVQGDTSTTFAASLASYYYRIPLGHIEAGLRTGDKYRPFPEEMNRKLTSAMADIHFAPTLASMENLLNEGVDKSSVFLTGNTVIDTLHMTLKKRYDSKKIGLNLRSKNKKMILVTTHRRENFGAPLRNICDAVKNIAKAHSEISSIVLPVHKNPIVSDIINETLSDMANIQLIEPLDYEPFVHLMKQAHIVLTDSGGIQEEAPSLGKPVLVLREVTERPEAVEAGTVKIVGTDKEKIIQETEKLLYNKDAYEKMAKAVNPYGDGKAASRVVGKVLHYFGFTDILPDEFSVSNLKHKKVL